MVSSPHARGSVSALSFVLQKQVESARTAFDRGKPAQAAMALNWPETAVFAYPI